MNSSFITSRPWVDPAFLGMGVHNVILSTIVDESLVHCHGGYEFEPRHSTSFLVYTLIYIYLFKLSSKIFY